jgi:hypothetical protein
MAKFIDAERGMTWVRLECAFPRNPKVLTWLCAAHWIEEGEEE